jgi:hypothetical protein
MSESDPLIDESQQAAEEKGGGREMQAANLFDLRRIIGALFVVLGVLLTILGVFDSQEEIDRAAGVNINLYAGLGMLIFGLLFLAWALLRPLGEELEETGAGPGDDDDGAGRSGDAGS